MWLKISIYCLLASITCNGQNLDLKEGFYQILEEKTVNSRRMLLREDPSMVYYVAEQPVVSINDRKKNYIDENTNALYFFYNEQGTKKLLQFTTSHNGGKLGFVYLGSLRKIYTVKEIVDNGIIELGSGEIKKVRLPQSYMEQ